MTRILKILSIAVLILLGYMISSLILQKCSTDDEIDFPNQKPAHTTTEFDDEYFFKDEDSLTEPQITSTKDTVASNPSTSIASESPTQAPSEPQPASPPDNKKPIIPPPTKKDQILNLPQKPPVEKPTNQNLESGNFVVVAGNYLVEANATQMVNKLKKAGYKSAERVVFDLSEFHTVIVGKFKNEGEATKISKSLKEKGFEVYIHNKKK